MKILFITNIPSPYYVAFIEELGKLAEVIAVFELAGSSERDKSWNNFKIMNAQVIILGGIRIDVDKAYAPSVKKIIEKNKSHMIIIANPLTPTGICAINYCKNKHIRYAIQSEGGIPGKGYGIKEFLKKKILRGAYLYLSGTSLKNEYFLKYGVESTKIKQFPFTSLYKSEILPQILDNDRKQVLRNKLGIKEEIVIISVGQFIKRKGHDILLEAFTGIDDNVGLYIVGGKPTERLISIVSDNKLKNIHFIDFLSKDKLSDFYMASNLFVLATREDTWGLVINEAMAKGLPIITTNRCVAGLELVEDGKNGYLIEINNVKQLRGKIIDLIRDSEKCQKMGNESLVRIKDYSYENMAKTIYEFLVNQKIY